MTDLKLLYRVFRERGLFLKPTDEIKELFDSYDCGNDPVATRLLGYVSLVGENMIVRITIRPDQSLVKMPAVSICTIIKYKDKYYACPKYNTNIQNVTTSFKVNLVKVIQEVRQVMGDYLKDIKNENFAKEVRNQCFPSKKKN
jgi:hypothetical protein